MMNISDELSRGVFKHFSMHPARLICFIGLIFSIIGCMNVKISLLAIELGGDAKITSRVKRLSRFLKLQNLCFEAVAHLIWDFLSIKEAVILTLDRTNWSFGKVERNYLVLAVVWGGCSIPILFKDLKQLGNSNTQTRIELIQRFINLFGSDQIACILADREFVGKDWFEWLNKNKVPYCIRVKNTFQIKHKNGGKIKVKDHLSSLKQDEFLEWCEKIGGISHAMIGMKIENDYLILLSNHKLSSDLKTLYKIRWTIETMFKKLKTNGFNFENTHLVHFDRAEKLLAIACIAYAVIIRQGVRENETSPISIKKTLKAKSISIFKYGLETIRNLICNIHNLIVNIQNLLANLIKNIHKPYKIKHSSKSVT